MRAVLAVAILFIASCGGPSEADPPATAANLPPLTTIPPSATTAATSSAAVESIEACDRVPFVPAVLPERVAGDRPALSAVEPDRFTAIVGTSSSVWVDDAGEPVAAVIRGSLPPERWLEAPAVITVREVEAALGRLSEGVWAVAWFEGPDRCDEYMIVLYPPTTSAEAQAMAESLVPAAG